MIFGIAMGICALIMFGSGIFQVTRKMPVFLFWGKTTSRVKDINAWNKKDGIMWIIYGVALVVGIIAGVIVNSTMIFNIIELACLFVPLPFMVLYHRKLVNDYIIQ